MEIFLLISELKCVNFELICSFFNFIKQLLINIFSVENAAIAYNIYNHFRWGASDFMGEVTPTSLPLFSKGRRKCT